MRSKRRYLIAVSLTVHLVLVLCLFVAGFWRIDRLDSPRHRFEVAVQGPPPPAPQGGLDKQVEKFKRKTPTEKEITKDLTQIPTEKPPETTPTEKPGDGSGSGSGTGSGVGSGSATSKGQCTENCGDDETVKPTIGKRVIVEPPRLVPPTVLRGLRIEGETQIHMTDVDKTALTRSGHTQATARVKVCVSETGSVTSVELKIESGYPRWDAAIVAAARKWRHRPYRIDNRPIPVCAVVDFNYVMK